MTTTTTTPPGPESGTTKPVAGRLPVLRVASPCKASWSAMAGDDRVRHCHLCDLNVYNLSAMTEAEAAALVREREGRLCVRFYRRQDGTVITRDCPVGWSAALSSMRRAVAITVVALLGILSLSAALVGRSPGRVRAGLDALQPFKWAREHSQPRMGKMMVVGEIAPMRVQAPILKK